MSGEVGCTERKVGEEKVRAEKELKDIDEHLPATTSFCPPEQSIRGKVEEPEVVSLLDKDSVSLTDSKCSSSLWAVTPMSCSTLSMSSEWESTSSLWAVTPMSCSTLSMSSEWESNSSLWAVTPMSCSTLSMSSEWESTDSVERATDKRGKELETDRYQGMVSLKTMDIGNYSLVMYVMIFSLSLTHAVQTVS